MRLHKAYIGIDVGATRLRAAIGNMDVGIVSKVEERTKGESSESLILQIVRMVRMLLSVTSAEVAAIGVGSIGPIDYRRGVIVAPPNVSFRDVPIVDALMEEFRRPTYILNDCSAAVLGEKLFGLGREFQNIFYVTLSTGIGGGAVVDGHLLLGKDGNAVEVGHMVVDLEGRMTCGCGRAGHWEAYCSGRNIPRFAKLLLESADGESPEDPLRVLLHDGRLTTEKIFELARAGVRSAVRIIEEVGRINAVGFANINTAYDPELITVGGAVAVNNPEMILDPVRRMISVYTPNRAPRIEITALGEDVVLYGAIALAANPPLR